MTATQKNPPARRYMNVYSFVTHHVLPYFDRNVYKNHSNYVWCNEWWRHTEALARCTALWNAWEAGRISKDPTAEINWLIHYAEPIMHSLMSPQGCFRDCSEEHNKEAERRQPQVLVPPDNYLDNDVESEEFALVSAHDRRYQVAH